MESACGGWYRNLMTTNSISLSLRPYFRPSEPLTMLRMHATGVNARANCRLILRSPRPCVHMLEKMGPNKTWTPGNIALVRDICILAITSLKASRSMNSPSDQAPACEIAAVLIAATLFGFAKETSRTQVRFQVDKDRFGKMPQTFSFIHRRPLCY